MKVINKVAAPAVELNINSWSIAQSTNKSIEIAKTIQPILPITLEKTYEVLGVIWQSQYVHYVLRSDLATQSDCTTWLCMVRTNLFEIIDNEVSANWVLISHKVGIYELWTLSHADLSPITQTYDRLQNKDASAQLTAKPFVFQD
jgi:hypothetical protein